MGIAYTKTNEFIKCDFCYQLKPKYQTINNEIICFICFDNQGGFDEFEWQKKFKARGYKIKENIKEK
tara:strand:+ start:350 stop:550 length:201 start_codon:yes stop_codon:yes gene_type:complete